jgi:hypothetical protein
MLELAVIIVELIFWVSSDGALRYRFRSLFDIGRCVGAISLFCRLNMPGALQGRREWAKHLRWPNCPGVGHAEMESSTAQLSSLNVVGGMHAGV